jgi:hypothetical protein
MWLTLDRSESRQDLENRNAGFQMLGEDRNFILESAQIDRKQKTGSLNGRSQKCYHQLFSRVSPSTSRATCLNFNQDRP